MPQILFDPCIEIGLQSFHRLAVKRVKQEQSILLAHAQREEMDETEGPADPRYVDIAHAQRDNMEETEEADVRYTEIVHAQRNITEEREGADLTYAELIIGMPNLHTSS